MIRRFSILYVGQIELEDIGRDGTPADARRYPNERLVEAYRTVVDVAAVTRRLRLGCAFNILPMWHPIRLAEDYAVADVLTNGRVVMGSGRGYHSREVESFGAPLLDHAANMEPAGGIMPRASPRLDHARADLLRVGACRARRGRDARTAHRRQEGSACHGIPSTRSGAEMTSAGGSAPLPNLPAKVAAAEPPLGVAPSNEEARVRGEWTWGVAVVWRRSGTPEGAAA